MPEIPDPDEITSISIGPVSRSDVESVAVASGGGWLSQEVNFAPEIPDEVYGQALEAMARAQRGGNWRAAVAVAYRAGYAEAVARLRDDARYLAWWSSSDCEPDGPARRHLADYLETVGPDGPDVTSAAREEG